MIGPCVVVLAKGGLIAFLHLMLYQVYLLNRLYMQCLPQGVASFSRSIAASRGLTQLLSAWVVIILFVVACAPLVSIFFFWAVADSLFCLFVFFSLLFRINKYRLVCLYLQVPLNEGQMSLCLLELMAMNGSSSGAQFNSTGGGIDFAGNLTTVFDGQQQLVILPAVCASLTSFQFPEVLFAVFSSWLLQLSNRTIAVMLAVRHSVRPLGHDLQLRIPANDEPP